MGLTRSTPEATAISSNRAITNIHELVARHNAGSGLSRDFYVDVDVFQRELDLLLRRDWLFAIHASEIPSAGDFAVFDIDTESVLVVRQPGGEIVGLHNVCRHRGSLIATEPCGSVRTFVCPYHQWSTI